MRLRDRRAWHDAQLPPLDLPERFAKANPQGIAHDGVRAMVDAYLNDFWAQAEAGLAPVFVGRAGLYKTYGAAVIARFTNFVKLPTMFVSCGPFFMELDAKFYVDGGMRPYKQAVDVPFLVLDDFTTVKEQSRAAEIMANLVNERFHAELPTVVTGNILGTRATVIKDIANKYRPDFARRLVHGAGAHFLIV